MFFSSGTNPNSEIKSAVFALVILALHVFISIFFSPASRRGRDFVGWEAQAIEAEHRGATDPNGTLKANNHVDQIRLSTI